MRQFNNQRKCLLLCLLLLSLAVLTAARGLDAPQITAVEPKTGATTPGSRVMVYGIGFSPDAIVYFGGLQGRETKFMGPSTLQAVTPYLRPGPYHLQLKSGAATVRSEVTFAVSPSQIDSEIDRALALSEKGQISAAIDLLTSIAKTNSDFQVRTFAYYQIGQIYFEHGDWLRWSWAPIFLDSDKSGPAVWTSWRYRLASDQSTYLLNLDTQPDHDLKLADYTVEKDVTQNPEPRFYRGLLNARYGNLEKAKIDSSFILSQDPGNPSYRALAVYIAVLGGDKIVLGSFSPETTKDARALGLLGEAAYLGGDTDGAQQWWASAAREYPLGAGLACWAGRKHLARGQKRIAVALLNECFAMAPNSKEAQEAKELLAKSKDPAS
jgi:tetratricopeptide (TPR) repeat protein